MATNLIESIQRNLDLPILEKIDPNTQEIRDKSDLDVVQNLAQASVTAILAGMYKYSRNHENCEDLLRGNISTDWANRYFGGFANEVIEKVSDYSGASMTRTQSQMDIIADEALDVLLNNLPDKATADDVKNFMTSQRNNILLHLPAELQIGSLLDDNSMDDRTNKMRGPISNLMHKIEKGMSGSEPGSPAM
ncbi:MAG: hypothetical protein C5B52_10510 [Bacteroidetes bacterium]|nr:MAG: hypothetical protein C5B52_10510 [Bacteroidota bacterium]